MDAATRNPLPGVPLVESPLFPEVLAQSDWDVETRRIAAELYDKGYAVFDFPDPQFDQRAAAIRQRLAPKFDMVQWRSAGWQRGQGLREQDAWRTDADVRALACNARVLEILSRIYGRRAWPFQTLNFPVGTQQHYHSDSIHFSSVPERFMCGVWVALEDVSADAGPLVYYPGSHKWPIVYNEMIGHCAGDVRPGENVNQEIYHDAWEGMVRATKSMPDYFVAKKGQALIWAANLLHGGALHENKDRTRWSQVTHYFFDNCAYVTPMMSDMAIGRLMVRNLVDVATGKPVENRYAGKPLAARMAEAGRERAGEPPRRAAPAPAELATSMPADFDPARYLALHPDVKAAGVDPTIHYRDFGRREGRTYK
jgi:hypothetical protein